MPTTRATLRRRGSSLAGVTPPAALKAEGLGAGDEVVLEVRKARALRDIFGMLADRPLSAQAIKNAIRWEDNE
jgi:hypothetical protein